ncbi:DNA polymerase III subunit alpha [Novispirillum sp. DQ9]|uniref:DNA polymerase III subunit alpha n=1 Tax=Novispirillum sp. DQ9 TaxID=3398612 RepID=UPI003C79DF3B
MPIADFVHLRVHTAYSMAEGAIQIKKLGKVCKEMAMPAVAITDTRNLFGGLEFSVTVAGEGVQPVIGCQVALRREDKPERGFGAREQARAPDPDNIVLLCQNAQGYANLIKLVSRSFLTSDGHEVAQVSLADLEAHADGLLMLTGGVGGPLGRLLLDGRRAEAEALLARLKGMFPGRLYMEVQRHDMPDEDKVEPAFLDLAYAHDVPLVATNDCYFLDEGMYEAHDVLICMSQKLTLSVSDRRRLTPHHRFKSAAEMRELFADLPEAVDNTLVIARRCAFMVEKRAPILPRSARSKDASEEEVLRQMAADGLRARLEVHVFQPGMTEEEREAVAKPYWDRLDYELGVIIQMGFPGYFIIVADFIQWGKDHGIPVGPGRGSGAGSLVAWVLTITDLDPLRFQLLFERFLNPERVSMPDFDVDFCQDRREEVIRYVQDAYGHDRVAQIITFGKLQARAVLRSVGRVLEMPLGYVDKICKMVPNNPANPVTLKEAIEQEPQLQALRDSDPQVATLLSIGQKLEGLYSHASTHAAGVVIGDRPLDELVPLYRDPNSDMPVTQFNMKWVESAGLVKFDFLGLKTLSVLMEAVRLIKQARGIDIDLSALPLDDRKSYDMLGRGETAGVFQLESQGMRDVLTKLKPDCLEDIIAVVALYRPGPMDNIPSYIARKKGDEPVDWMHPDLEPVLKETYGIMIYQEQVMQAAQVLAGYSLGGADLLRRAMGKKIKEEMDQQRKMFEDGCEARGTPRQRASEIFDTIAKFAGYGFNKSHAAAYALVAYQTAYVKANYPVEFMAAIMTYDMQNTDKLASFKSELQRLDVPLLPPDINKSVVRFSVEVENPQAKGAVRYALAGVKNVGEAAMESIVAERQRGGPFRSIQDFAKRVDTKAVNKRLLENLTRAGAFDGLEKDRDRLFHGLETVMRHAQAAAEERSSDQVSLFGGASEGPSFSLPALKQEERWSKTDLLNEEKAAIGFFLSAHPLDSYATTLARLDVVASTDLLAYLKNGGSSPVKMAAIVGARKEKVGKNGSRYAFVTLSDAGGSYEAMFFSEVLNASREMLDSGKPLLISMDARLDGEQVRLNAQHVSTIDSVVSKVTKKVMIYFDEPEVLPPLKQILSRDAKGHGRIVLVPRTGSQEVEISLKEGFALNGGTIAALKDLPGIAEVREI